ncbi:hypothetical protein RJ639_011933 [Escallonia herrerae]|uniref:Uncharacterized protein n=1 Tax=Escallonia herrerae TaxID=1293975 RepID=A0AA88VPN0_9ASTE|nr:hypothetical protein RJ639_011933 [Escallonia herrerae]
MVSTKTLVKMVKKWQNLVAIRRKRISFARNSFDAPLAADKGHFVVYSEDGRKEKREDAHLYGQIFGPLCSI